MFPASRSRQYIQSSALRMDSSQDEAEVQHISSPQQHSSTASALSWATALASHISHGVNKEAVEKCEFYALSL